MRKEMKIDDLLVKLKIESSKRIIKVFEEE